VAFVRAPELEMSHVGHSVRLVLKIISCASTTKLKVTPRNELRLLFLCSATTAPETVGVGKINTIESQEDSTQPDAD
jgi:hypothetical protein